MVLFTAVSEDVAAFAMDMGGVVEFKRVALTREQVVKYNLPGAPPKKSSHSTGWRAADDAVQAEALAPNDLAAEIRQAVEAELDLDLMEVAKSGEAADRDRFDEMMRKLRGEEN